jgi:16S rRNA (adenine1518-N6/adenine1519-N6)-dimethyltransferase
MKYNKSKIEPNKRFGQNFLIDKSVISKIILAMPKDILIVEIGPGLGDLTKELLDNAPRVIAYEVDERLCKYLNREFKESLDSNSLELRCGDVLEYWKDNGSLADEPYYLVANLPYYIATNIILKALEDSNCKGVLTMVQKEVALKFASQSQQREFCALSVIASSCGSANLLFDIAPEAFNPPPKVVSSILEIKKSSNFIRDGFDEFLRVAFSQPRKKLIKNLSKKFTKESLERVFNKLSIDTNLRPHQVVTRIYHLIYKELKEDIDGEKERDNQTGDFRKSRATSKKEAPKSI